MEQTAPSSPITVPAKLIPPINIARWSKENHVKACIKEILDAYGWFHFAMAAGGFGAPGIHDRLAFKDGVLMTIEAKFGRNKPTAMQRGFAAQITANSGYAFCVNERNIDHLVWFLESFEIAQKAQMQRQEVPEVHGARMLNAISALTDMWGPQE